MARPDLSAGMSANLSRDKKKPSRKEMLAAFLDQGDHVEVAQQIAEATSTSVPPQPILSQIKTVAPPPIAEAPKPRLVSRGEMAAASPADQSTNEPSASEPPTITPSTSTPSAIQPQTSTPPAIEPLNSKPTDPLSADSETTNGPTVNGPITHSALTDGLLADRETTDRGIADRLLYKVVPNDILNLSYNQAAILEHLIESAEQTRCMTSARTIAAATGIGYPTVRDALQKLIRKGFMAEPVTIRSSTFQGFSYVLNGHLAQTFTEAGGLERQNVRVVKGSNNKPSHNTPPNNTRFTIPPSEGMIAHGSTSDGRIADGETVNRQTVDCLTPHSSSSSSKDLNLLTTKAQQTVQPSDSKPFVLAGPVGMFWEGEGLQEGQALTWCRQFEVEPEQMRQQLAWAQFDLVHNGKEEQVQKDAISWFFGVLRRTSGCYPRPTNYKTPAEIRAEAIERDLAEEKEATERLRNAELEQAFQQILADPEGPEYQDLLAQIDDFAKKTKGQMLVSALRQAFLQQQALYQ